VNTTTNRTLELRASTLTADLKADPVNGGFMMAYLEDTLWRIAQGVERPQDLAKEALFASGRDFDREQEKGNAISHGKDPRSLSDLSRNSP